MPGKTEDTVSVSLGRENGAELDLIGWRGTRCGTPAPSPGCVGKRSVSGKAFAGPPSRVAWPRTEKDRTRRSGQVDQGSRKARGGEDDRRSILPRSGSAAGASRPAPGSTGHRSVAAPSTAMLRRSIEFVHLAPAPLLHGRLTRAGSSAACQQPDRY